VSLKLSLEADTAIQVRSADICPYLVGADVMITDHRSAGFEYLGCNRPLVRLRVPEFLNVANVQPDYEATPAQRRPSERTDRGRSLRPQDVSCQPSA
jgi:CDP-glycerol glycerophosphotransferase (TagB/SpsB family)